MLEALMSEAYARKLNRVYLHAQSHAISFYEKHGFRNEGSEFIEAGISHVKMIRDLQHISVADG